MPSDGEIEASLRNAIRTYYKNPTEEAPTINSVRAATAEELGLAEDFFQASEWKSRSKDIIREQFDLSNAEQEAEQEAEEKKNDEKKRQSLKRSSPALNPQPRKKSKLLQDDDPEDSTALSEPPDSDSEEEKPKKKKQQSKPAKPAPKKTSAKVQKRRTSSELSDAPSPEAESSANEAKPTSKPDEADDTSSELSSVIDDPEPPKKKPRAKNGDSKIAAKERKPSKSKASAEPDPNAEEIKRLQGWLVKCGIRKVWGKELKPFETPKAKISHLRSMLADAGMTGRYSNEKAAQIKEARELAADIEAVQEGNERWGKASGDEEDGASDGGKPKRRLIRGAQNYAFLSSDGEETD